MKGVCTKTYEVSQKFGDSLHLMLIFGNRKLGPARHDNVTRLHVTLVEIGLELQRCSDRSLVVLDK
jgi:hypothetical protein